MSDMADKLSPAQLAALKALDGAGTDRLLGVVADAYRAQGKKYNLYTAAQATVNALDRRGYICWSIPRTLTEAGKAALAAAGV